MRRERPEQAIQRTVTQWLDLHGLRWCHVPNGGARSKAEAAILSGLGVKPGVPDILIFDRPPRFSEKVGAAIELKAGRGKATEAQRDWLRALEARGWYTLVSTGLDPTLRALEDLGYGRRRP